MKKRINVWMVSAIVVAVGAGAYFVFGRHTQDPAQLTQYKVAAVTKGEVKKTVSATGTLQPWKVVDIKSKAGGRVLAMLVDVGTSVKPGQIIARIDPSDTLLAYSQAKADTESARARTTQSTTTYQVTRQQTDIAITTADAALQAARESRDAAASRLQTARREARDQPGLTESSISQAIANEQEAITARAQLDATNAQARSNARSAYNTAIANEKNAQANLARQKSLLAKGFVSQQALDAAQTNYDVAQANVESARTKLNTLSAELKADVDAADARVAQAKAARKSAEINRSQNQAKMDALRQAESSLKQAKSQVIQAAESLRQAKVNVANNKLRSLDITSAKATEMRSSATLQNAKDTLDQTTVRSPSYGVVLTKYVDQGTIITSGLSLNSTGSSIVQIGDTTRMFVDVTVDETDIASVDTGQKVDVSFDAYPGVPFEGKVARIDPQAVVTQNVTNIHVRVEIDNSSPTFRLLKPGMNATCEFVVDDKPNVLNVPSSAVQTDDNGSYVQIASGGTVAPVDPTSGLEVDPNTKINVKLARRAIEIGVQGNDATEVTSGLKEGDVVVVDTIAPATTTSQASSPFGGGGRGMGGTRTGGGGGRSR